MTDQMLTDLGEFEGTPVSGVRLIIRNTGDGLSDAMEIAPAVYHHGQAVGVYLRGVVVDIQHPAAKPKKGEEDDEKTVIRVHIVRARSALVLDGALEQKLNGLIGTQASMLKAKRDAERGQDQLPGTETEDDDETE